MNTYILNQYTTVTPPTAGEPLVNIPKGTVFKINDDSNTFVYGDNKLHLTDRQILDLMDRSSYYPIEEE